MLKLLAAFRIKIGVCVTDLINLYRYTEVLDRLLSYMNYHVGQFDILYIYCDKVGLFKRGVHILSRRGEKFTEPMKTFYLDTPISDYQIIYDFLAEVVAQNLGTTLGADIFIEKRNCECFIFPSKRGTVKIYLKSKLISEEDLYTYEE